MKDAIKIEINKIIETYFSDRQINLKLESLESPDELISMSIVLLDYNDPSFASLNPQSTILNKIIFEYCSKKIKLNDPKCIEDVDNIFQKFISKIQEENNINLNNPFRPISYGLYGLLLGKLRDSGFDVYSYAVEKNKSDTMYRFNDDFDQGFIFHLLSSNYSQKELFEFCNMSSLLKNNNVFRNLFKEIFRESDELAYNLYKFGASKKEYEQSEFQLRLICKLYNSHSKELFLKIKEILAKNPTNGIHLLAFSQLTEKHISEALNTASNCIDDASTKEQLNNLFYNIAESQNASSLQRESAYKLWVKLLENSDTEFCHQIIHLVSLIDKEKDEIYKFNILVLYLNKTSNFSIVKNFFHQFKNPSYLYKLLSDLYQKTPGRKSNLVRLFSQPVEHLFRVNREESENYILEFFNPVYKLNTLPVDIIMIKHSSPFKVDLLKLETEEIQLAAINKFYYTTSNFDKILPILLQLRKSAFPKVKESLKAHLAELAYQVYGKLLVEWINSIVGKERGLKSFLKTINIAADLHEEERAGKFTVNDLNPFYHEKNLLELYNDLSKENQTKLMQESRDNPSFLMSHFKNSNVVRGNSVRHGDCKSTVTPLGTVSVSSMLDSRVYKNPDLLEFELNNLQ